MAVLGRCQEAQKPIDFIEGTIGLLGGLEGLLDVFVNACFNFGQVFIY